MLHSSYSSLQTNPPRSLEIGLEPSFHPRELSRGGVLYHEGTAAESVFRVEEGLLKLSTDLPSGKERILSVAGPGDVIGALFPAQEAYLETASALSQRVRLGVTADAADPALTPLLQQAAGTQLGRLRETLEDGDLPVPARLARTFLRLGERFGAVGEALSVHLTLPLTHDTLAAMIGAARETTTTVLGEMRAAGVLAGTRGRYHFDYGELSAYAATHGAL